MSCENEAREIGKALTKNGVWFWQAGLRALDWSTGEVAGRYVRYEDWRFHVIQPDGEGLSEEHWEEFMYPIFPDLKDEQTASLIGAEVIEEARNALKGKGGQ